MQNLVKSLKAQGAPIDGIGLEVFTSLYSFPSSNCIAPQSHFIVNELPANIQQNMQAFVNLGVEVAVTELDIRTTSQGFKFTT